MISIKNDLIKSVFFCYLFLNSCIALSAANSDISFSKRVSGALENIRSFLLTKSGPDAPYRGCFTKDLYAGWNDQNFDQRRTQLRFYQSKVLKIIQLLKPLELDQELTKKHLSLSKNKTFLMAGAVGIVALPVTVVGGALVGGVILLGGEFGVAKVMGPEISDLKLEAKHLKRKINALIDGIRTGDVPALEIAYLKKKKTLPVKFQDLIETFFIDHYETGSNNIDTIKDLLRFSHQIVCICDEDHPKDFREKLTLLKTDLPRFHADVLTSLAQSSFMARKGRKDARSLFYIQTSSPLDDDGNETLAELTHIAFLSGQSFFIFESKNYPVLNNEILEGTIRKNKGLLLYPFLDGFSFNEDGSFVKNVSCANPILFIPNFEILNESRENDAFLLTMLDKEKTSFRSEYFQSEMDCSHLNIICIGDIEHGDIYHPGVRSRLRPLKFDTFL